MQNSYGCLSTLIVVFIVSIISMSTIAGFIVTMKFVGIITGIGLAIVGLSLLLQKLLNK